MAVAFQQAIPLLRNLYVAKAKEFYVDFLGFRVDWEHRFAERAPINMRASRNGVVLHLTEITATAAGAAVFVRMTGIDEFHKEITSEGYQYYHPNIEQKFYAPGPSTLEGCRGTLVACRK